MMTTPWLSAYDAQKLAQNAPTVAQAAQQRNGRPPLSRPKQHQPEQRPALSLSHKKQPQRTMSTGATSIPSGTEPPPSHAVSHPLPASQGPSSAGINEPWLHALFTTTEFNTVDGFIHDEPVPTFGDQDDCAELGRMPSELYVEGSKADTHQDKGGPSSRMTVETAGKANRDVNTVASDTELDIVVELTQLNLCIYKLNRVLSNSGWAPVSALSTLPDEMMDITRRLLGIMRKVTTSYRKGDRSRHRLPTPDLSVSDLQGGPQRPSVELPSTLRNNSSPETGTILLLFSCRQRLLDMFRHVCLLLQTSSMADPANIGGGQSWQWNAPQPHREELDLFNDDEKPMSNAQIVMLVELVAHLLDRLDHRQQELVSALSSNEDNASDTSILSSYTSTGPQPIPGPQRSLISNLHDEDRADSARGKIAGTSRQQASVEIARIVLERMTSTRSSLDHHIDCVKLLWKDLDGI
ncbi:hypothetical protein DL766_005519 [Monosporascus sp. MC13-8B]|nr:hypothetical protein DL766_005519 [Monosporascus sp. MC13-8B]